MDHARRQSSDRREFFSARDRAICFDTIGDFFADGDDVRNFRPSTSCSAGTSPRCTMAFHAKAIK
jgi:hypothetical protein